MTERLSDVMMLRFINNDAIAMDADVANVQDMASELIDLRILCMEVHEVVGVLSLAYGDTSVERVLDNLSAAGAGKSLPHVTLLPFHAVTSDPVMPENPSDAVLAVIDRCKYVGYTDCAQHIYRIIRDALANEKLAGFK